MHDLRNNPDQRLDLVVAGTKDAVMMVESEAYELTEEEMLGAVNFAHEQIQPVIDLIIDLAEDPPRKSRLTSSLPDYSDLYEGCESRWRRSMRARLMRSLTSKNACGRLSVARPRDFDQIQALTEEQLEDANLGSALKKLESRHSARRRCEDRQAYRWPCATDR